jgi:hypothetical protein
LFSIAANLAPDPNFGFILHWFSHYFNFDKAFL